MWKFFLMTKPMESARSASNLQRSTIADGFVRAFIALFGYSHGFQLPFFAVSRSRDFVTLGAHDLSSDRIIGSNLRELKSRWASCELELVWVVSAMNHITDDANESFPDMWCEFSQRLCAIQRKFLLWRVSSGLKSRSALQLNNLLE